MEKEYLSVSNGEFTLSETEVENQFLFYRNDGEVLGDVGRIPMVFYREYIVHKMIEGEITDMVMNNIYFETSGDGKMIRLTISDIGDSKKNSTIIEKKQSNFLEKFIKKFLHK